MREGTRPIASNGAKSMVKDVRVNEVIASIVISSKGLGWTTVDTVIEDLRHAMGATERAAREAIGQAVKLRLVRRSGNQIILSKPVIRSRGA
jgi:hypothetical protein